MKPVHAQPLPCDFCKAKNAPLGFAPPPRLGLKVRRPIKTCMDRACQDQAIRRVAALVEKHDPFARPRDERVRPAPPTEPTKPPEAQASLF